MIFLSFNTIKFGIFKPLIRPQRDKYLVSNCADNLNTK